MSRLRIWPRARSRRCWRRGSGRPRRTGLVQADSNYRKSTSPFCLYCKGFAKGGAILAAGLPVLGDKCEQPGFLEIAINPVS